MSDRNSLPNQSGEYICKICGSAFLTVQALAAHIDSEHPDAEQPEIF
jgi:hypothetical protein